MCQCHSAELIGTRYHGNDPFLRLIESMMTAMPLHHGAGGDRWSRANVKEVLPELPSPLFMHQLETVSGPRMLAAFEAAGYRFPNGSVLFGSAAGRPYLNIGLMQSMMADIGLPPELTDHALGRGTDLTEPSLQWNWTRILCRLPTIFSALFRQLRAVPATMRWFSHSDGILAEFSLATMRTLRQASDEVLLKDFDRAGPEIGAFLYHTAYLTSAAALSHACRRSRKS